MSLYLIFQLLLALATATTISLMLYALRHRQVVGALPFLLFLAGASIYSVGYMAELASPSLATKIYWDNLQFSGTDIVAAGLMAFGLAYTRRDALLHRATLPLLIEPLANTLMVWSDATHHLVRQQPQLDRAGAFPALVYGYGPWMWGSLAYTYALIVSALVLLIIEVGRAQRLYQRQVLMIVFGLSIPLLGSLLTISGSVPIPDMASLDLTPITFALASPIAAWSVFRYRLLGLAPVARHRVVEQMADRVLVLDMDDCIVDLNPAARTIVGEWPGGVIGRPVGQVLSQWLGLFKRYQSATSVREEVALMYQGRWIYLDLQISVLCDDHSQPIGRLIVWRDITDRKRAELALLAQKQQLEHQTLALQQAKEAAEAASRAKSTFLSAMSHELRTPLTAILGYTELIELGLAEQQLGEITQDIGRIKTSGLHLLDLINSILEFSKIEAGKVPLDLKTFDVAELVGEIVALMRPMIEQQSNRFEVTVPPQLGAMHADPLRVRQVLFNLLSNAAKFTSAGTVSLRVMRYAPEPAIAEHSGEARFAFEVVDTGIGIAEAQLLGLFQEFVQGDMSPSRQHGGTGLGLALSRKLCRLMGGDISVASTPGVGSTFIAWLPAHVVAPQLAEGLSATT
ncbi:MAG TPA: histidine kinase N-terminal 7TM domain-containing protein [Kouleothrix sp.]|uniref:sensor histidine kinase n=1 Tax=Kouleothrix sp. TaxID=2779161 RepID=UPI002C245326|nr:histidine kinase N-terminal 7TM domain-containing protein [Kouleothrix sp.]